MVQKDLNVRNITQYTRRRISNDISYLHSLQDLARNTFTYIPPLTPYIHLHLPRGRTRKGCEGVGSDARAKRCLVPGAHAQFPFDNRQESHAKFTAMTRLRVAGHRLRGRRRGRGSP